MVRNNRPLNEEHLDDFEVMYVEAVGGLNGAQAAFQDLEGRLDQSQGQAVIRDLPRRMLQGVCHAEGRRRTEVSAPRDLDHSRRPVCPTETGRLGGSGFTR